MTDRLTINLKTFRTSVANNRELCLSAKTINFISYSKVHNILFSSHQSYNWFGNWRLTDSWGQTAQIVRLQRIKHKQRVTINLHSNITDSKCWVRAPKPLQNSSISQLAFDNKKVLSSTSLRTFIYINAFGTVQKCKNQNTSLSNDFVLDSSTLFSKGNPLCLSNFKILSEESLPIN